MTKHILDPAVAQVHADFCSVLSSPTRLMIMWMLSDQEKTVGDLAHFLGLPIANVSQHLRVMRDKGAVVSRKEGQKVFYQVANKKFLKGCMIIREGIIEQMQKGLKDFTG